MPTNSEIMKTDGPLLFASKSPKEPPCIIEDKNKNPFKNIYSP
jgi:hypothetical protein